MLFGSDSYEPNNIPDPPGCPRGTPPKYNSKNFDINLVVILFYSIFTEQLKTNIMATIKPRKVHYRVIDRILCVMCDYNPAKEKTCKSCGNWDDKLPKKTKK